MVCELTVKIEAKDSAAITEALLALGYAKALHAGMVQTTRTGFKVDLPAYREADFRVEYAKAFAKAQAKRNFYRVVEEKTEGDTVSLRFVR